MNERDLLAKFPAFNRDWPESAQLAWFDAYLRVWAIVTDCSRKWRWV